jgi:hypothetical protein
MVVVGPLATHYYTTQRAINDHLAAAAFLKPSKPFVDCSRLFTVINISRAINSNDIIIV